MPDWVWIVLAAALLVGCYAFLGSFVGGAFGPDRPDRGDEHAQGRLGGIARKVALIALALLALYAVVDYVAEW
jgi:hypothetical protein